MLDIEKILRPGGILICSHVENNILDFEEEVFCDWKCERNVTIYKYTKPYSNTKRQSNR